MADYKKMYTRLFNAVTDATKLLQTAQLDTEEIFMEQPETLISILPKEDASEQ